VLLALSKLSTFLDLSVSVRQGAVMLAYLAPASLSCLLLLSVAWHSVILGVHSCVVPYVLPPIGLQGSPHSGHLSMRAPFSIAAAKAGLMLVTKICSKSCIMSNKAWAALGRSLAA
jgi:hypothetical protein